MMDSKHDELLVQIARGVELLLSETASAHRMGTRNVYAMEHQAGVLQDARELFEKTPGG